jgi:hypothetical protein
MTKRDSGSPIGLSLRNEKPEIIDSIRYAIHDKPHYQECDFSSVTLPVQKLSARSVY